MFFNRVKKNKNIVKINNNKIIKKRLKNNIYKDLKYN
jgi:hypothetical protein